MFESTYLLNIKMGKTFVRGKKNYSLAEKKEFPTPCLLELPPLPRLFGTLEYRHIDLFETYPIIADGIMI